MQITTRAEIAQNQSSAAEEKVLGCLLVNNAVWFDVSAVISEADFGLPLHRILYAAICGFLAKAKTCDFFMLIDHFAEEDARNAGQYKKCIHDLIENVHTTANAVAYAKTVRRYSIDRQIIKIAHEMIGSVQEEEEHRLANAQRKLADLTNDVTGDVLLRSRLLPGVLQEIDDRRDAVGVTGLATGFNNLDKMTQGFQRGDLILLGARPAMGKTMYALNIADYVTLITKKTVAFFSLEMNAQQLIERSLSNISNIHATKIKTGQLTPEDFERITEFLPKMHNDKMIIDDRVSITTVDIRAKCQRIKRDYGLDLVIIDYLSLMSEKGENETLRLGKISRDLKILAKELNVPVIAISQLNRDLERRPNKRPMMADLRSSGNLEQDADIVIFLYRDEVYDETTTDKGVAELIIAKHRNGEIGNVYLSFQGEYCRFKDLSYIPIKKRASKPFSKNTHFEY